jgi:hypothetical protein
MNRMEQWLAQDLSELLDEIARDVPSGTLAFITTHDPKLRSRIDEVEARLAVHRNELIGHYASWRSAIEELQNLWSLAGWKAGQPGAADALEEAA